MGRYLDKVDESANSSLNVVSFNENPFERIMGRSIFGSGEYRVFYTDGTFNTPLGVEKIRVRVLGGGGAGGAGSVTRYTCGGAGGGFAMKTITVAPLSSYVVTVGVGGTCAGTSTFANGTDGGTSSFGSVFSATGGKGGISSTTALTVTPNGGIGVGGDVNFMGGKSGSVMSTSSFTGGGSAATIVGDGQNSSDMSSSLNDLTLGGGASCTAKPAIITTVGVYGGAGVGGATNSSAGGADIFGNSATSGNGSSYPSYIRTRFITDGFCGGGGASIVTATSTATGGAGGAGGGGGAARNTATSSTATGGAGGAGGGGGAVAAATSGTAIGGAGGAGAGGGAVATSGASGTGGKGGNGLVIVEW